MFRLIWKEGGKLTSHVKVKDYDIFMFYFLFQLFEFDVSNISSSNKSSTTPTNNKLKKKSLPTYFV